MCTVSNLSSYDVSMMAYVELPGRGFLKTRCVDVYKFQGGVKGREMWKFHFCDFFVDILFQTWVKNLRVIELPLA